MGTKEQRKVGARQPPRGQQMGSARPDRTRRETAGTPALRGNLKRRNKMFGDKSTPQVGTSSATGRDNSPSTPALDSSRHVGETTGEMVFKRRLAQKRSSGS